MIDRRILYYYMYIVEGNFIVKCDSLEPLVHEVSWQNKLKMHSHHLIKFPQYSITGARKYCVINWLRLWGIFENDAACVACKCT